MVVIRTPNWLGDVIMSSVAVKKLIEIHGSVDILTKNQFLPYWMRLPGVRSVYHIKEFFRLKGMYETGYLFTDSFSSALIFKLMGVKKIIGYRSDLRDFLLDVKFKKKRIHFAKKCMELAGSYEVDFNDLFFPAVEEYVEYYKETIGENYVVIAPFSNAPARRWFLKNFIELMLEINEYFVVVGTKENEGEFLEYEKYLKNVRYKNMIGKTDLLHLGAIIKNSKMLITNESGIMHIGRCFNKKVVVISGPSDRNLTGISGSNVVVLQASLRCVPCVKNYCYRTGKGFMECMKAIGVEDVINAAK